MRARRKTPTTNKINPTINTTVVTKMMSGNSATKWAYTSDS